MERADIISAIQAERVKITNHARKEAENDHLSFEEIYFSVVHGEILKQYLDDRPYPSCLIYGKTFGKEPVHSVWAYNVQSQWAVLITVYRPNPDLWRNWKERRRENEAL